MPEGVAQSLLPVRKTKRCENKTSASYAPYPGWICCPATCIPKLLSFAAQQDVGAGFSWHEPHLNVQVLVLCCSCFKYKSPSPQRELASGLRQLPVEPTGCLRSREGCDATAFKKMLMQGLFEIQASQRSIPKVIVKMAVVGQKTLWMICLQHLGPALTKGFSPPWLVYNSWLGIQIHLTMSKDRYKCWGW